MPSRSAAERLPDELRKRLIELLTDPNVTQQAVADIINAEAGESVISKSSVNRYARKMERFAEKNRQARQVAEAYLEKTGGDTRNQLGKVVNEQIRLMAFDLIGEIEDMKENGETIDIDTLTDLIFKVSKGLKELEQAEKLNAERSESIRKAALAEAAEAVEETAKSDGLSAETVDLIKKRILGL
jgi:hypothetical protein